MGIKSWESNSTVWLFIEKCFILGLLRGFQSYLESPSFSQVLGKNPQLLKLGRKLGKTWEKEETVVSPESILTEGIYNTEMI